jgi:hypothetical protein
MAVILPPVLQTSICARELALLEQRMTIKLGGLMVIAVSIVETLVKLLKSGRVTVLSLPCISEFDKKTAAGKPIAKRDGVCNPVTHVL